MLWIISTLLMLLFKKEITLLASNENCSSGHRSCRSLSYEQIE
jgi:hypothetical protein